MTTNQTPKASESSAKAIRLLSIDALRTSEARGLYGLANAAHEAARLVRLEAYGLFGADYAAKTSGAKAMSSGAAWTAIAADAALAFAATDFAALSALIGEDIAEGVDVEAVAKSVREAIAESTIRQYAATSAWVVEAIGIGEGVYVPTLSEAKLLKAKADTLKADAAKAGVTVGALVTSEAAKGSVTKYAKGLKSATTRREATASKSSAKAVDKAIAEYIAAAGTMAANLATITAALRNGEPKADKAKALRAAVKVATDKATAITSALQAYDAKAAKPKPSPKGKAAKAA